MFGISKVIIFFAIIISTILYWTTSNVCRYNFTIEKKTNTLNIISAELAPSLPMARVYYFRELNCNNVELAWDIELNFFFKKYNQVLIKNINFIEIIFNLR